MPLLTGSGRGVQISYAMIRALTKKQSDLMLPEEIPLKKANFYADLISFGFWVMLFVLITYMQMAAFVFTMLFTLFILSLVLKGLIRLNFRHKGLATVLSLLIISGIGFMIYESFSYFIRDLDIFLKSSEAKIVEALKQFEFEEGTIDSINDLYRVAGEYLKKSFKLMAGLGITLLQVVLGIVFGIIIFHHDVEGHEGVETLWSLTHMKIYSFSFIIFRNFSQIMTTQILISAMNTVTISVFALIVTYILSGDFLPHYYIIIPLVTIFSLIPVIGNVMVNILIGVASLQVSTYYVVVAIGYFFIVHKLELIVIGKFLNKLMKVPFVLILFSMVVGELIFNSPVGIIMGMLLLFVLLSTLKSYRVRVEFAEDERTD